MKRFAGVFVLFMSIMILNNCSTIDDDPSSGPDYVLQSASLCRGIIEYEDGSKECVEPGSEFENGEDIDVHVVIFNLWAKPFDSGAQFRVEAFYNDEYNWEETFKIIDISPSHMTEKLYFSFPLENIPPGKHDYIVSFRNSANGEFVSIANLDANVTRVDPDYIYVQTIACLEIQDGPDWTKIPIGVSRHFPAGSDIWVMIEFGKSWVDMQFHVGVKWDGGSWYYEQETPHDIDPVWGWEHV